jgi:uncharacterized membrane protein YbaN (DUF454 family)
MKGALRESARAIWFVVGLVSLGLGAAGAFLPILPTTPFIILAAIAFSNSSERLHTWLVEHNVFGPLIENWRRYGAISRSAKVAGVLSMVAVVVISIVFDVPTWLIGVQVIALSGSALFILTRPMPPR